DTHSQRRIVHLLGQRQNGRCGNLLVSELYAGEGCWSGYPPHKHDTEDGDVETRHEELYHYRFQPETGFGSQITYDEDGPVKILMTRNGDTVLVDRGYHPTVTSPGHRGYIFTILVGKHRRGLIQRFDPAHQHLTKTIPGIDAMRDKFK
ncbi:5-deoxy-glucuronate isomerase, partial [Rhizobium ruizarguesonis]